MFRRSGYSYIIVQFFRFPLRGSACTRIIMLIMSRHFVIWADIIHYVGSLRAVSFGLIPIPIALPIFLATTYGLPVTVWPWHSSCVDLLNVVKYHTRIVFIPIILMIQFNTLSIYIYSFSLLGRWEDLLRVKTCCQGNFSLYHFGVIV